MLLFITAYHPRQSTSYKFLQFVQTRRIYTAGTGTVVFTCPIIVLCWYDTCTFWYFVLCFIRMLASFLSCQLVVQSTQIDTLYQQCTWLHAIIEHIAACLIHRSPYIRSVHLCKYGWPHFTCNIIMNCSHKLRYTHLFCCDTPPVCLFVSG